MLPASRRFLSRGPTRNRRTEGRGSLPIRQVDILKSAYLRRLLNNSIGARLSGGETLSLGGLTHEIRTLTHREPTNHTSTILMEKNNPSWIPFVTRTKQRTGKVP